MRTFFLLLGVQLRALSNSLAPVKPGEKRSKRIRRLVGVALLVVFLYAYGLFMFTNISLNFATLGLARVLPSLGITIASLMGVVFTFFKTNGTLFGFKDYDLVMSLPVPRRAVVASRFVSLICAAEALALLTLPFFVVYFSVESASALQVVLALVSLLLAPLVPTVLAVLLSYVITAFAARFRHSNIVSIVLSFAALAAVTTLFFFFGYSSGSGNGEEDIFMLIASMGAVIESAIASTYPPAAWAAQGITQLNGTTFIGFSVYSILIPLVALELIQRSYITLNGMLASRRGGTRIGKAALEKSARSHSVFKALVFKEWRGLIGIPSAAFNCLSGYIFIVAIPALIGFSGIDVFQDAASVETAGASEAVRRMLLEMSSVLIPWALAFASVECFSSSVSFSLEGRSAWLPSSLPLSVRTLTQAKFASNAILYAMSLVIGLLILLITGALNAIGCLEVLVVAGGAFMLWSSIGIHIDMRRPNTTWTSPQEVVKRSLPVIVNGMAGPIYVFVCAAAIAICSFIFSPSLMHVVNVAIGLASFLGGLAIFEHGIRKTPALYR